MMIIYSFQKGESHESKKDNLDFVKKKEKNYLAWHLYKLKLKIYLSDTLKKFLPHFITIPTELLRKKRK